MRIEWQRGLWLVLCLFGLLLVSESSLAAGKDNKKDADYYELMKIFVDTFEQIDRNYVKDVDRRELMEAAIKGMTSKLDQYSTYISPEQLSHFSQMVDQEFGGIGIQVHLDSTTKRLTVMTPLPETPAYKAGVQAGDVIMEIEGKSTEGYSIESAIKLLKGKPGEPVTIGVKHLGSEEIETIKIIRAVIRVSTVLGDRYNPDGSWNFFVDEQNKIAYVRLTHFSRRSTVELRGALQAVRKAGMQGLVLDLRFNPGGLLSQATAISDLFIEQGRIVSTKGRNIRERVWDAKQQGTYIGFPMAVLVNRGSASASEIVSACLQDHKRAVIIGERTYGKGSVQNIIELEGGDSALKLTTASYHRPSGKNIHKFPKAKETDEWGVMPDKGFHIRFSDDEMRKHFEDRRQRDVLGKTEPVQRTFKDRQLTKAVEYLLEKLGKGKSAGTDTGSGTKRPKAVVAPKPMASGKSAAFHLRRQLTSVVAAG